MVSGKVIVLVPRSVEVRAEDNLIVLAFPVVVLANVVSAKDGVKVFASVVTGKVGTLLLCTVVACLTGVDSESVVVSVDCSVVSESVVDWTVLLGLVIVEVIPTVVPVEE